MSISRISILLGGLVAGSLSVPGCLPDKSFFIPFEANCLNNGGDSYCAVQDPSVPYCVAFEGSCYEERGLEATSDELGCVAQMPEDACWAPCGLGETCLDSTETTEGSSGGTEGASTSSTTVGPETDTEEPSTTAGPSCSEAVPCIDPAAPFCIEGECSPCSSVTETTPDEACAALEETTPLCVGDSCVQCSADAIEACGGTTPLCDDEANTCVACSFHEECQAIGSPACNIATGACFDPAAVTEVDAGTDDTLQPAIDAVADGAEHAIVLTGGGQNHTVTIDGGKTITIVSDSASVREVRGNSGNPTVLVSGVGTTAYLHRVALTLNGDDVGVSVASSATLYADSTRIAQNSGGGITLASGTGGFLRNCMVAGDGGESSAVSSSGDLSMVYCTLGRDTNFGDPVLECSGGSATVRNSVIVSETNAPGAELNCPGATVENTAQEATLSPEDWFPQFGSGDYALSVAGGAQFDGVAVWQLGDPPFDFDGDARPSEDGAGDFAGADVP